MCRLFIVVCVQILLLAGCDAADPLSGDADGDVTAKLPSDDVPDKLVSIYLEPQFPSSHTPVLGNRIVVAEPVYTVPVSIARASGLVDGINVVYVGLSCQHLLAKYPESSDCTEEETAEFEYGDVVSTANTDAEGFASLLLGGAEKYRVRVQSWATEEDSKCYWGGEETIDVSESAVPIPVLVFCE